MTFRKELKMTLEPATDLTFNLEMKFNCFIAENGITTQQG